MARLVDAQDAVVALDYGQFWLWTDGWDPDDLDIVALIERAQACDNIAQERHGLVVLSPHQNNFEMPFRVERWSAPADDDLAQWQEAFEAHLVVGEYGVTYETPTLDGEGFDVPAGTYHALITGRGFVAHGWPGSTTPGDEWRMRLWPADEAFEPRRLLTWGAHDAVLRQESDAAAYSHSSAAETDAPPPAPTAEELAERAAEDEHQRQVAWAAWEAEQEAELWGGTAPTDELRAIGGRTSQLAARDRQLVDVLAALPPARQRDLAAWAARRACENADITDRDWVQAALDTVARGTPLPAPWGNWDAVWDRLSPSLTGAEAETRLQVSFGVPHVQPPRIPPEAAAIDAVHEAAAAHPAQAVMGAVDALASGYDNPTLALTEVRHQVIDEPPAS